MSDSPLHTLDPLERFSRRAAAYARHRPDYPPSAIEAVLKGVGNGGEIVVADVGAGTGISSRMLAERGARVRAVEPNAAMCSLIPPDPRIEPVAGGAESLPFDEGSIDLVTAFQSFHWFDPERFLAEAHRVLRPRGRIALVWNERDDERDPFTADYRRIVREASGNHPAESRMEQTAPLYASSLFTNARRSVFPHRQILDRDALLGRLLSISYLPHEGEAWERLAAAMLELHARRADSDGRVALVYETRVYLAERALRDFDVEPTGR
ncbi:MAG TPA: class I SAM-dependent methyltransferase [Thermoanaerobaculia bacterium]|nr:class I SAM-dependent methyltransferase [Thermoanaerobaculia bacterium]